MNIDTLEVPKPDINDVIHTAASTVIGLSSAVGIVGAESLFKFIIGAPLEERRDRWMQAVADAIRALQQNRGIDIQNLQESEEFVTLLVQATQIALKTHLESKHNMLKTALINAVEGSYNFDRQQILLNLVDRLTPTHINVLIAVRDLGKYTVAQLSAADFYNTASNCNALPNLEIEVSEFIDYLRDLEQAGLIVATERFLTDGNSLVDSPSFRAIHTTGDARLPRITITKLAQDFTTYINS